MWLFLANFSERKEMSLCKLKGAGLCTLFDTTVVGWNRLLAMTYVPTGANAWWVLL
jgi:hypothetical protein